MLYYFEGQKSDNSFLLNYAYSMQYMHSYNNVVGNCKTGEEKPPSQRVQQHLAGNKQINIWVDDVTDNKGKHDKHFPVWGLDNFIRRLFENPNRHSSYVTKGQIVADLGCGPGYYALPLAKSVGPEGKVYAVDSDEKAIRALEKKASKYGYHNIEAHACSASDLSFIKNELVDFILADGLLCSIAPKNRESAVNEIKRILKPSGKAYLNASFDMLSNIDKADWGKILEEFRVEKRGKDWVVVSKA